MVGEIKNYRFSNRFKKQYKSLPLEIRQTFNVKLPLFLIDMLHPSLRIKKSRGLKTDGKVPSL
jgi:hypothetical protein